MAIIKGAIQMTGGIRGVSFYTLAGSDKVIMRTKGGPKARRMKVGKEFEKLRQHQSEWSACVKFSQGIRYALGETYRLADYNVSPVWNGMGKNLMKLDNEHIISERNLKLSAYRQVLENFSLNRKYPFNTVFRVLPRYELSEDRLKATVLMPRINTQMDLVNIQKLPYFRLIISLGIVSDITYRPDEQTDRYFPELGYSNGQSESTLTEWYSANDIIPEQSLMVELLSSDIEHMSTDTTVLLGIGIEFGNVGFLGQVSEVKRAGCAKILAVL